MHPLLNIATLAARAAGGNIMHHYSRIDQLNVEQKGKMIMSARWIEKLKTLLSKPLKILP
jgi:hypothetical protein